MANFRTANYLEEFADTNLFEQWDENGRKDTEQRAALCLRESEYNTDHFSVKMSLGWSASPKAAEVGVCTHPQARLRA